MKIDVSFCIPVFHSEKYLNECLSSIPAKKTAGFNFEVVVCNDSSEQKDENGKSCSQIVKEFKKSSKTKVTYFEHSENKGLLETRRELVFASKGKYIFFIDSDDKINTENLNSFVKEALILDADIIQGWSEVFGGTFKKNPEIFIGKLNGNEILKKFLIENLIPSFVWGRLQKRELYLDAFNEIPPVFCITAEDFLISTFSFKFAQSYVSLQKNIYFYRINSGITSQKQISSIREVEKIASAASIFTVLFSTQQEKLLEGKTFFNEEEIYQLKEKSYLYIKNNIEQIKKYAVEELQIPAMEVLKEFWGSDYVDRVIEECKI